MKTQPTAQLDGYAYDMLMFYLQEHSINIADIDHIEVELRKDKTRTYYRHIKIIKKNGSKGFFRKWRKTT